MKYSMQNSINSSNDLYSSFVTVPLTGVGGRSQAKGRFQDRGRFARVPGRREGALHKGQAGQQETQQGEGPVWAETMSDLQAYLTLVKERYARLKRVNKHLYKGRSHFGLN
ncbi:hypothetical protein CEXT_168341 [Caerostris extrusa]|uniref:Uncharacterized protein n=1 Tax=Caerostris extrusa TaxID=172846 RepID=A0AAV4Y606_CAEEX|nr:hypothetical protein CEXT_168341 [Caerostris extrusa]